MVKSLFQHVDTYDNNDTTKAMYVLCHFFLCRNKSMLFFFKKKDELTISYQIQDYNIHHNAI